MSKILDNFIEDLRKCYFSHKTIFPQLSEEFSLFSSLARCIEDYDYGGNLRGSLKNKEGDDL